MSYWKHLNENQRKLIASMLTKKMKLVEIADLLEMDPTSISKEIKRNRVLSKKGLKDKVCKYTTRYPYVCNGCMKKYNLCPFTQYKYDSHSAQKAADYNLVTSRQGLNMTDEEYFVYDTQIIPPRRSRQSHLIGR